MGAAGKKREEELLAQIANLNGQLQQANNTISELKATIESLKKELADTQTVVQQRDQTIAELKDKIAQLDGFIWKNQLGGTLLKSWRFYIKHRMNMIFL